MSRLHDMKVNMSSDEVKERIAKMKEANTARLRKRQKLGSDTDIEQEGKGTKPAETGSK